MKLRIETLGACARVLRDGVEVEALAQQRLRCALLVYLAVEAETTRERVIAVLWPDREPDRARHVLSQALYELRQLLGEGWIESRGDVLRTTDVVEVDALEFERAVDEGRAGDALASYAGAFLEGCHLADTRDFEGWVDQQRAQLVRVHRRACREVIDARAAAGDLAGAETVARAWARLDPLEDEAQHRLIELLVHAGRRTEAIQQYETYERLLATELELEPLEETRELMAAVRAGSAEMESATLGTPLAVPPGAPGEAPPGAAGHAAAPPGPGPAPQQPAGAGWPAATAPAAGDAVRGRRRRRLVLAAGAAAIVLAAVLAVRAIREPGPPPRPEGGPDPARVAVLYFDDLTGGASPGLADGLTETLIQQLSQVPALDVIPRNGVRPYRGLDRVPLDTIVADLGVGSVVSGSVASSGDRLRVIVHLIDAGSGMELEGRVLERPAGDLFDLMDDLSQEVSTLLRRSIGAEVRLRERRAGTSDARALELLQNAEWERKNHEEMRAAAELDAARRAIARADSLLVRAEAMDPRWVEPVLLRGRLTLDRVQLATATEGADTPEQREEMVRAVRAGLDHAERAIELAPTDGRAHELRGMLRFEAWDRGFELPDAAPGALLDGSESDLRTAVRAQPELASAWATLSDLLRRKGEFVEAKLAAQRAYAADSFLDNASDLVFTMAQTALDLSDWDEAVRWCEEGRRRFPQRAAFAACALTALASSDALATDVPRAWELARDMERLSLPQYRELNQAIATIQVAAVLARASLTDSAAAVLAEARRIGEGRDPVAPLLDYWEAAIRLELGQHDRALDLIRSYLEVLPQRRSYVAEDSNFRPLREDPRFLALVSATEPLPPTRR